MKQIILSEEEAKAIVIVLSHNWIQPDLQMVVWNLIERIKKELES